MTTTEAVNALYKWQDESPRTRGVVIAVHAGVWYVDLVDGSRPCGGANESLAYAVKEAMGRLGDNA